MLDTAFAGKFCVIEKRHSFRCFSICSVMLNQLCNHNRVLGNLMLPKYALGKYMVPNMIYWADTESRNSHKISGLWKVYCSVGGPFISIASVLCFLKSSCTFFKRLRFALEWKKSVDMYYTNGKIGISSITIKLKIIDIILHSR